MNYELSLPTLQWGRAPISMDTIKELNQVRFISLIKHPACGYFPLRKLTESAAIKRLILLTIAILRRSKAKLLAGA